MTNYKKVINKNADLLLIQFPIIFPIIYYLSLLNFPAYESLIIFLTLFILAEPHFGATWPFFLDKQNKSEIINNKLIYIYAPILIIIFSVAGFFLFQTIFILIFFAFNIFHVTRQSIGISKLYSSNKNEIEYQELILYNFNLILFIVGVLRFYLPNVVPINIYYLNLFLVSILLAIYIIYYLKYKNLKNLLTLITGTLIFYPICFMDKPIHALIMGVTMHYSQYLVLTSKIFYKRRMQGDLYKFVNKKNIFYFATIVLVYGLVMSSLAFLPKLDISFKNIIIIPLVGQMLHFYLDSLLWRFSNKHHREVSFNHIYN
ncbi:hypothetical protein OAM70_04270 [Pelagibacteraceae bacterium]|nr:hypothetical protein [Pelagibacteraceae bacterium]MDC0340269.1 hypothetical protein [Pelagibacteraceae bacterium]MDC0365887.1 hypothetical protein [Pelagibacteraceae bacterium]|tara:strand:- start:1300 stop:2247 length:948 start_codon:yes stop_codon:yes gene_type:complete